MSVLEVEALRIVNRFKVLPKFPRSPEGVLELVRALQTAKNNVVAEHWAEHWLRSEIRAPLPSDIYSMFDSPGKLSPVTMNAVRLPSGDWAPPVYKCNLCEDTGWYITRGGKMPDVDCQYEGARKCLHPPEFRGELYGRNL